MNTARQQCALPRRMIKRFIERHERLVTDTPAERSSSWYAGSRFRRFNGYASVKR